MVPTSDPSTDEEPEGLLYEVFMLGQYAGAALREALVGTDLGPNDFAIYSALATRSNAITPTELGEQLKIPPSTLTGYLQTLSGRGHIARLRNPMDGRSALIELTPSGKKAHRDAARATKGLRSGLDDRLGVDRDRVLRTLLQLKQVLGEGFISNRHPESPPASS